MDEVLQVHNIFTNVTHGKQAKKKELKKWFPSLKYKEIIKLILDKGEMQISSEEQQCQQETLFNDIANIIAEKCVHPDTNRPFSNTSIKSAMRNIHYQVRMDYNAKKQALSCIKLMK